MLEGFDLQAMQHLSADSMHVITESMKLGYADRDDDIVIDHQSGLMKAAGDPNANRHAGAAK